MDKEYFLNSGIQRPLHFEPSPILNNCSPEQSSDCFFNPSWDKFDSALSSMVSSPVASNSAISNDSFAIRELIGKLGNICNSGEISTHSHPLLAATATFIGGGNMSANTSCYTTPLNSPPKLHFPIDHQMTDKMPHLGNSIPMNPNLPAVSADPGFAERAAKFSCFGSRSFNGRTSQLGLNNIESKYRSSQLMNSAKLQRVCSSPSLEVGGSPMVSAQEIKNSAQSHMGMRSTETKFSKVSGSAASDRTELASSNEGSSVSEQIPNGEIGLKTPSESNSRKRKGVSRGKSSVNATKAQEEDDPNSKRSKSTEANEEMKGTSDGEGDEGKKQAKSNSKPPEPPRDYIHVRARRGQATDSHSLAERVRREKIGERMKLLQDLVPGCNKVTGKALMLDEIINYVQSLQRQVEFLSMKLASVNSLDFNMDNLLSKDVFQSNPSLPHQAYPLESSASASAAFFGHHNTHEISQLQTKFSNGAVTECSVDPIGTTTLCGNIGIHQLPPPTDEFCQGLPQFPTLCEDDLQSIVQMGFHSQNFPGSSQPSHMKIEL